VLVVELPDIVDEDVEPFSGFLVDGSSFEGFVFSGGTLYELFKNTGF
jgi:hypothetical protein